MGSVAEKSDAILLADISPRLEEKNPDGLLELELLSLEQHQIQKTKEINALERIICENREKIFVLGQRLAQDINDLGRDQLIISEIEILKNRIVTRINSATPRESKRSKYWFVAGFDCDAE